jgi:hypothetical protein
MTLRFQFPNVATSQFLETISLDGATILMRARWSTWSRIARPSISLCSGLQVRRDSRKATRRCAALKPISTKAAAFHCWETSKPANLHPRGEPIGAGGSELVQRLTGFLAWGLPYSIWPGKTPYDRSLEWLRLSWHLGAPCGERGVPPPSCRASQEGARWRFRTRCGLILRPVR